MRLSFAQFEREVILEDTLPEHITLFDLAVDPPLLWEQQRARLQQHASTAQPVR